jgi:hypothetical protein
LTASTTADITSFGITGAITASNKVYDGLTGAAIASRTLTGVFPGDVVSYVGGTANFNNKNIGSGKPVNATGLGLGGLDAGNYTVNTTASTTADITARSLTVTATGINKVYENGLAATVTLSDNRVAGDVFTDSYTSAAFVTKDVGTGITVNVSGISISGTDAGNYTFNTTASTTANITKRPVTVTVDNQQVIWTGSPITPPYTISLTTGTMAPSETFSSTLGTPAFTPATVTNVGVYTPVTVSGLNNTNYLVTPVGGMVTVLDQTIPIGTLLQLNPVALNTAGTIQANINDVNTGNSNIVSWKVSVDGAYGPEMPVSPSTPNANVSTPIGPYNSTDVKKICFTGKDAGGNWSNEVCGLLAIYDPSAGFVTGGGWIDSPPGAYTADLTLSGKANFGFNAKYQKGANVPIGNTEFQFQAGNLNFSSTDFQWLVVQGGNTAQFKGTGAINRTGKYNFIVTAMDGDNFGNKKPDSFRMKITDFVTGAVIYDNQMGKDDSGTFTTTLGGGSIVIHDK